MNPRSEKTTEAEASGRTAPATTGAGSGARRRKSDRNPPMAILEDVRRVSTSARVLVAERDHLIRSARAEGASWAELAEFSGLSRSGVRRVCERSDPEDR